MIFPRFWGMLKNRAGIFELCRNAMLHCETCSVKNHGYRYIQIIEATHSSSQRRSMWIGVIATK
jgi:hypothetical protein